MSEYNDDEDNEEQSPIHSKRMAKISQSKDTDLDYSQWQVGPNGLFRAAAQTIKKLHPGVYKVDQDDRGLFLQLQNVISDNIVSLPETANVKVLSGMKKFWQSKARYNKFGLVYKRGILLWGPPGSGKSVTINLLMQELIDLQGIVLLCSHPDILSTMLSRVRLMEPDRSIIVVLEDIDEIIDKYGEHSILAMLDGENMVSDVTYLATTNYPDKLGARIVNRPSRFDERIYVGMPSAVARAAYLKHATTYKDDEGKTVEGLDEPTLEQWTKDTEDFSIAHLRELVAASFCLEQPYKSVLKRLKKMLIQPKFQAEYRSKGTGFMSDDEEKED
jgi:SpoVK/Ycf46/Vps4 family AAA+-type ATPase